jgi:sec-independent protein translocase protein TatA
LLGRCLLRHSPETTSRLGGERSCSRGEGASLRAVGIESPVHLLFLGAVALMVLGPKRLPELARALGKGVREFRESIDLKSDDDHD